MINQVAQARPAVAAQGFAGELPAAGVTRLPRGASTTAECFREDGETLDTSAHPDSGWLGRSDSPFLLAYTDSLRVQNVRASAKVFRYRLRGTARDVSGGAAVVVGAGPYGLAAAAHLRAAGVETHIFGRPMEFWKNRMPAGMFLRSAWEASSIAHPERRLTLDEYRDAEAPKMEAPVPIADFLRYADWYRRQAVADVDERTVSRIEPNGNGFRVKLEEGDELHARRVVVATGLAPFAARPREFDAIPA